MFENDPVMQNTVKNSVKRTLWCFAQSNLMNRYSSTTHTEWQMTWWRGAYIAAITVTCIITVGAAAMYALSVIKGKKEVA